MKLASSQNLTISDLLKNNQAIYQVPDDRLYDLEDLFYYHQKWLLRYTDDKKHERIIKATKNLIVSMAWYFAIINRFKIDLQNVLIKRYSYKCPFCLEIPCFCEKDRIKTAKKTGRPVSGIPKDVMGWQKMIEKIYPADQIEFKNLEILRSQDTFHQTFRKFRRTSGKRNLHEVEVQSADYFIEFLKVANELKIDLACEFAELFSNGCFVCHKTPCECFYIE